ncbi:MAG: phosphoglycolate phosphatase [Burkholderiaceae bacterium]|jgi:phosphoglycolate phosphatase
MARLVVFDLDGTLIDTAQEITEAVNRTLAECASGSVPESDVRRWIGHGTGWLMKQAWADQVGEPEDADWSHVMARFVVHYHDTAGTMSRPYPFVRETLAELQRMGIARAILTNKESRFTARVLEAHGLTECFDLVVSGDSLPTKKPDPSGLFHCIDDLGSAVGSCLFVGDSEIDVATAKAAGVVCWAVPYGYNHGRPIALANPDRLVEDIRPVPQYFLH